MAEDICVACGATNAVGAKFCRSCGAYLAWEGAAQRVTSSDQRGPTNVDTGSSAPHTSLAPPDSRDVGDVALRGATDGECPECGKDNPPQRRYCRRCGHPLRLSTSTAPQLLLTPKRPWWKRFFGSRTAPDHTPTRAERRAYRRSLAGRARAFRVGFALTILVTLVLAAAVVGQNPVGWARHRLDDLRGSLTPITPINAAADPPRSVPKGFSAAGAIDRDLNTAWSIRFSAPGSDVLTCGPGPVTPALLLTSSDKFMLRAFDLRAGLSPSDPDRLHQWRPAVLEIRGSGGLCERVGLNDTDKVQRVKLKRPMTTNSLRVAVVGAYPPQGGALTFTAITEITLLARPK